jgi:hypothetical protein
MTFVWLAINGLTGKIVWRRLSPTALLVHLRLRFDAGEVSGALGDIGVLSR